MCSLYFSRVCVYVCVCVCSFSMQRKSSLSDLVTQRLVGEQVGTTSN